MFGGDNIVLETSIPHQGQTPQRSTGMTCAVSRISSAKRTYCQAISTKNAAAETHARDMSVQNRPWHFGSDGSSPLVRAQRSGFTGRLLGENISETYETELETLSSWMAQPDTRVVIMEPSATRLGFSWYQEPGGKIWWTMMTGA